MEKSFNNQEQERRAESVIDEDMRWSKMDARGRAIAVMTFTQILFTMKSIDKSIYQWMLRDMRIAKHRKDYREEYRKTFKANLYDWFPRMFECGSYKHRWLRYIPAVVMAWCMVDHLSGSLVDGLMRGDAVIGIFHLLMACWDVMVVYFCTNWRAAVWESRIKGYLAAVDGQILMADMSEEEAKKFMSGEAFESLSDEEYQKLFGCPRTKTEKPVTD